MAQYETQLAKLSKYAPEMVNTDGKRRKRFLQGLNIELQRSLVSTRMDTYADVVEFAQKAKECEKKWKDLQSYQKTNFRNMGSGRGGPLGQTSASQKKLLQK